MILSGIDSCLCQDAHRKQRFNIRRHDQRTLITSVGDVVFDSTYFRSKDNPGEYHYLLEEILGLDTHERFSEAAETAILTEALKSSYEEAAKIIPSKSGITKTTVQNKVHGIADFIPFSEPAEKKSCPYLYIEADEDHIAEQHGRWKKDNNGFICRLAYVYELKQDVPRVSNRKELVGKSYFSGLYEGTGGVKSFWENVESYIEAHYNTDTLKRVFISGDGAPWIKSGTGYVDRSLYCIVYMYLCFWGRFFLTHSEVLQHA